MLTTLFLLATLTSPAPTDSTPLAVEARFDGRGRVHTVEASLAGDRLTLTGAVTAPVPYAPHRRAVTVEVLDAAGAVLATREVPATRPHLRVIRRHPVRATFHTEVDDVAGAVRVRVRAAR